MTNHYLSTLIWRLPPVLIIHLKRFQLSANGYIKIQSNVEYPITDLDLYDYLVTEKVKIGKADLSYWELLGGKYDSCKKDHYRKSSLSLSSLSKEEIEWRHFEETHQSNVSFLIRWSFIHSQYQRNAVLVLNMIYMV